MNQNQIAPIPPSQLFSMAMGALGACEPGGENAFFARVPGMMRRIEEEHAKAVHKISRINNCIDNPDKKYGSFKAVLMGSYVDTKMAHRGKLVLAAYSKREGKWEEQVIRTQPTNDHTPDGDEAREVMNVAGALVGRMVRVFKMPDWTATGRKIPAIAFHIEDAGEVDAKSREEMAQYGFTVPGEKKYPTPADRHAPPAGAPVGDPQFAPQQGNQAQQNVPAQPQAQQNAQSAPVGGYSPAVVEAMRSMLAAATSARPDVPFDTVKNGARYVWGQQGIADNAAQVTAEQQGKANQALIDALNKQYPVQNQG